MGRQVQGAGWKGADPKTWTRSNLQIQGPSDDEAREPGYIGRLGLNGCRMTLRANQLEPDKRPWRQLPNGMGIRVRYGPGEGQLDGCVDQVFPPFWRGLDML